MDTVEPVTEGWESRPESAVPDELWPEVEAELVRGYAESGDVLAIWGAVETEGAT